jgi:hypothetical protein
MEEYRKLGIYVPIKHRRGSMELEAIEAPGFATEFSTALLLTQKGSCVCSLKQMYFSELLPGFTSNTTAD